MVLQDSIRIDTRSVSNWPWTPQQDFITVKTTDWQIRRSDTICLHSQHFKHNINAIITWINGLRVIPCLVIQQNGDFSSDPQQNSRNFRMGNKLLSSTKLEFLKSDLYFRNYEHLKFWCFLKELDQKILGVLLLELHLIVTPLSLNIFIQYFAVKWKAPRWTKQHRTFFTGDLWTLVNSCYK